MFSVVVQTPIPLREGEVLNTETIKLTLTRKTDAS